MATLRTGPSKPPFSAWSRLLFSVDPSKAVSDDQNIDIVYAGVIGSLSEGNESVEASQV